MVSKTHHTWVCMHDWEPVDNHSVGNGDIEFSSICRKCKKKLLEIYTLRETFILDSGYEKPC